MTNSYILSLITWLPAVGAILILAFMKKDQSNLIKKFATGWFVLDFIASLWLLKYNRTAGGMQFLEDHEWIPVIGARYQMGVDGVAVLLIVLTTLLGAIAALSSWEYIQKREKEYYALLLFLQTAVIGVFASMDLFLFYLFFEVSLVPMYFLIGIWGGENRLYAAIKFFLYTLVGSVVMLLGVLKMYFLTQDTALTSQITPADDQCARRRSGGANDLEQLASCRANGTGTFNILFMQAMGTFLPPGTMQVLLFAAFALGLCDQGADVSVSHVAAGCARRSAHGRLSDSRRHSAEAGNLRFLSIQPADVSVGFARPELLSDRLACEVSSSFLQLSASFTARWPRCISSSRKTATSRNSSLIHQSRRWAW